MDKYEKWQSFLRMILFIELFANINSFFKNLHLSVWILNETKRWESFKHSISI